MPSKQFILRIKITVQLSSFQPRELVQEHLITRAMDRLWFAIKSRIELSIKALDDEAACQKRKITLNEFFLFELKKTSDGGEALQPVIYWIRGNEIMPEYSGDQVRKYIKNFLDQKHVLTAIETPPLEKHS